MSRALLMAMEIMGAGDSRALCNLYTLTATNRFSEPTLSTMKKHQRKASRANFKLGDLIAAVSSCSKNNRETVAAVADLLDSGKVRFQAGGRKFRARVF